VNPSSPPQLDEAAVERAIRVAVERERAVWRQKLKRGRVRFRRPQRYPPAARTFDKLKVLLDEIETEWADSQQTSARHCVSGNRRGATNPAEDRTVSAESFDETRQLPSSVDVCAHMRNNFVDTRPLSVILISNNGKRDLGCVRRCGN
jgi:hypothetical protein